MPDYTQSPTKLQFHSNDDQQILAKLTSDDGQSVTYKTNTTSTLDLKENPLALHVLQTRTLDLADPRVAVQSVPRQDLMVGELN